MSKDLVVMEQSHIDAINELSADIHQANVEAGWWTDIKFDEKIASLKALGLSEEQIEGVTKALGVTRSLIGIRNIGEVLCLIHSEISEAMEGHRKNLMDDKLPHRKMVEVEVADALIRVFDLAGSMGMDLGGAIAEKRLFNAKRSDHKIENRLKDDGKKY